ncbi:uncharacterized protein LOC128996580 [Macrosteles quadrilineatus]|uniref:uncharacterized protein LOC128996580 n=1 Tax=Macrosteles quadrilineatus TaxID=74068 RepID=UPI0023E2263A|nr:uncharacterized protein LOC128996580 [Macrosteles quadrilineatus]
MFKKRRSMLGRRHLATQQPVQTRPAVPQATTSSSGERCSGERSNDSWRGRSAKKRTPHQFDKTPKDFKDFKKCLFTKSPGFNFTVGYRSQGLERNLHSSNENFLDETGITSIAPTPTTTDRLTKTPATLQRRRIELESLRYGPLPTSASIKPAPSISVQPKPSSYISNREDLKPPDLPETSRLDRILLEEKLSKTSYSIDFNNLKPPNSPDASRFARLIMKEKLQQPLDPDLDKIERLTIVDPNPQLQFSPPLSSTCIGSPDSGKKNITLTEDIKETVLNSGRKLSTINEDCDVSVIEFELNERTITDLDNTLMNTTINNTVKYNHITPLEKIPEDPSASNCETDQKKESEPSLEKIISDLNDMEQALMNRAAQRVNALQKQCEAIKRDIQDIQDDCQQDVVKIRAMKKMLDSSRRSSSENKENSFKFKVPTTKKALLQEESKWLNSVKKENPGLLKTPKASRKITKQSASWTPHSLSRALCEQMSELYEQ